MSYKSTSYAKERYFKSIVKVFSLNSGLAVIVSKKTYHGRAVNMYHKLSIIYCLLYEWYSTITVSSNAIFSVKRENVREQSFWVPLSSTFINYPCTIIISIAKYFVKNKDCYIIFLTILPLYCEHSATYCTSRNSKNSVAKSLLLIITVFTCV